MHDIKLPVGASQLPTEYAI